MLPFNPLPDDKLAASCGNELSVYHLIWTFENIVGKGENAGNQHFLPFLP